MASRDNVRARYEALAQQTEHWQPPPRPVERWRRWWPMAWPVAAVAALGLALALPVSGQAKTFRCGAGDVACLIDAINEANANGQTNTIRLAAGTYTLTAVNNAANGLPLITSPLTITGRGAETTIIERDASAPGFRILQVAPTGTLTLKRLMLRGGSASGGGGIANSGTLSLMHSAVTRNRADFGAGISTSGGTVTITHSTIADNDGHFVGALSITGGTVTLHATTITGHFSQGTAGIANGFFGGGGTVLITESAITDNIADLPGPAGIFNNGTMVITNTTIARNTNPIRSNFGGGGLVNAGGTLLLTNSTVAENAAPRGGGGILQTGGTVLLLNTILAQNRAELPFPIPQPDGQDCEGSIISLGHNLIGDPTGCSITLQPSDLTGDPGFGPFTDNGRPGNGHFPLLPTSQAVDAGNDAFCPRTDQLGRRRIGPCDMGAIEFRDRDDRHDDREDDKEDDQHDDTGPVAAAQAAP
jgi:hypothetical protein